VADTVGGYSAAAAIPGRTGRRSVTGEGAVLDIAVMDGVLRTMQFALTSISPRE